MIAINQSLPSVMAEALNPQQPAGDGSMRRTLYSVTEGMEIRLIVDDKEPVMPYWLPARFNVLPVLAEQRPFPDPNAVTQEGRISPRRLLQQYRRINPVG